jgi:hypothetical protein
MTSGQWPIMRGKAIRASAFFLIQSKLKRRGCEKGGNHRQLASRLPPVFLIDRSRGFC